MRAVSEDIEVSFSQWHLDVHIASGILMAGLYGTINNAWIRYKIRTLGYLCTCPVLSEDSVDPMCICTLGISQNSIEANF